MKFNIAPLGFSNDPLLRKLILTLSPLFQDIKVFYPLIDVEMAYSLERRQYNSTKILEQVIRNEPSSDAYMMILTELDLFVPVLTHIFGEAQLKGNHSIVSICRLYEEFYTSESNPELLFERAMKEILHELGHNFGLIHCIDWDCVMHVSNAVEEIDIKGRYYCSFCLNELKENSIPIKEFFKW